MYQDLYHAPFRKKNLGDWNIINMHAHAEWYPTICEATGCGEVTVNPWKQSYWLSQK
jgi:hypothetical protein